MEAVKEQKGSLQLWLIAKANLRHNFVPLVLLSVVILALVPVLFGITGLDSRASAQPLEMLVSTIGMVLLVPIFQPEQNREIEDITASKYVNPIYVYLIRAVYSILGIIVLVLAFSGIMLICGCKINFDLILGTIADAVFLGSVGSLTAAVTNNLPMAFMLPFLYYLFNMSMQSRLGNLNLFAMISGSYAPNAWLLGTGLLLLAAAVTLKRVLMKYR